MRYRLFERLLLSNGWNSEEDDEGDMCFTKGDATLWVQWNYCGEHLDRGYIYDPDSEVSADLYRVAGLSFRGDNTRIWFVDGQYWSFFYY